MKPFRPLREVAVKKTLCFLLFIPVLASAAGFYVQPEFWGKDGAHRSLRKDLQTLHAQGLLNRFEWKFFDGVGLRAGAVFPVPALKADLGFSGGYVFGPAFNYHTYTTAIPDFVRVGGADPRVASSRHGRRVQGPALFPPRGLCASGRTGRGQRDHQTTPLH